MYAVSTQDCHQLDSAVTQCPARQAVKPHTNTELVMSQQIYTEPYQGT